MNTHIFETHFFILQNFYFRTLKPLFIYVTVFLDSTFAQTYRFIKNDVNLNLGIHPKPKISLFTYSPQPFLQPSTHCLLIFLFIYSNVYSNLQLCRNDVYQNTGICPKPKIGLFSFNPQPTVYLSTCLFTPNVNSNPLVRKDVYLNLGICPKQKNQIVQLQPENRNYCLC